MDFNFTIYQELLKALQSQGFSFQTFADYSEDKAKAKVEGDPTQPQPQPQPVSYHYRDFGILTEPYFDFDFNELFYLTDTGRRWDGWKFSVRDKIPVHQDRWIQQGLVFQHTGDIINAARAGTLPPRVMITVHPQRWNDAFWPWAKELLWQNVKNQGKLVLLAVRSKK